MTGYLCMAALLAAWAGQAPDKSPTGAAAREGLPGSFRRVVIDGTERLVEENNLVFANEVAARLFLDARQWDPNQASTPNRDKAVELYAAAIGAQPGAEVNAFLADRVAQMYAFYEDRTAGFKPDPELARQWWELVVNQAASDQLLFHTALMGMYGFRSAEIGPEDGFRPLLEMTPEQIAPPRHRYWPDTERGRREMADALARDREAFTRCQTRAVERVFDWYRHKSVDRAARAMHGLLAAYPDTPVATEARRLLAENNLPAAPAPAEPDASASTAARSPAESMGVRAAAPNVPPPAPVPGAAVTTASESPTEPGSYPPWAILTTAAGAVAVAGTLVLVVMRRRRIASR